MNTHKRKGMRKAFGMFEMMLVLVLVALLIAGIYMAYKSSRLSAETEKGVRKIGLFISAAERVRSYSNDAYPAAGNTIANIQKLRLEVGGASADQKILTWRYRCARSSRTTLSLVTTPFDSTDVRDLIMNKMNTEYAPWAFAASGSASSPTITVTKPNVACN